MAETLLGNGDRAYEYYWQINSAAKNDQAERYEIEPYVYAQNVFFDEHPQAGLGRNSWLSGTASWCHQAATQWIIGIRPTYAGLRVAPCIASEWEGFSVSRRFRGAIYNITVSRGDVPGPTMTVDGELVGGDVVAPAPAGTTVEVQMVLPEAG